MLIHKRRFEDVELLSAATAAQLGSVVRERVLNGWDLFGGMRVEGGTWAQWVVKYAQKEDKASASGPEELS